MIMFARGEVRRGVYVLRAGCRWTQLPPKGEFTQKISEIYEEARERLERRKMLPSGGVQCDIDFFYESKDEDED